MNGFDDDDNNRQKRRRVSKACDSCRHAKLKCDGARPQCGTCSDGGKPCSYGSVIKRRGLRTGYVRALECLWGLVFQSIGGSIDTVERLIASNSKKSFWVRDELRDDGKAGETPMESWKSSTIPQTIDTLLSTVEDLDDLEDDGSRSSSALAKGADSGIVWGLPEPYPASESNQVPTYTTVCQRCSGKVSNLNPKLAHLSASRESNIMDGGTSNSRSKETPSGMPELPHNTQMLLSRYFAWTHPWLPIVERHAVYRSLFAYRRSFSLDKRGDCNSGENALLWAICAYSSAIYDPPTEENCRPAQKSTETADSMYITARNMIPLEKENKYCPNHVLSILLLGLVHYSRCEWDCARLLCGQAILIASHIGLCQHEKHGSDQSQRIWLGCFVLDTLLATYIGRTPQVRTRHVRDMLKINEYAPEEWEPWHLQEALLSGTGSQIPEFDSPTHSLSVFRQLIQLLCIMNDWMCSPTRKSDEDYKNSLRLWKDELPEHMALMSIEAMDTVPTPPNVLNLHMIYVSLHASLSYHPQGERSGDYTKELKMVINEAEGFLAHFDQKVLPPSTNLLQSRISQQPIDAAPISDVVAQLKMEASRSQISQSAEADANSFTTLHHGTLVSNMPNPVLVVYRPRAAPQVDLLQDCGLDMINAESMPIYNLDPRIEENFGSFIGIPWTWPDVSTEVPLDLQPNDEGLNSERVKSNDICSTSPQIDFSEDITSEYLRSWEGTEMYVVC